MRRTKLSTAERVEVAGSGGAVMVLGPDEGETLWQPVPANGSISIRVAPGLLPMEHPLGLGTQTVPRGCHVREHFHPDNEEVLHFISGRGRAVIEGKDYPLSPGVTVFVGKNRRHMFINDGEEDLHWLWLIAPNGLEDFFRAVGRERRPGEPAPEPFARPADVLEIERRTVFGILDKATPVEGAK
jgi:mannose-6-phosphate isomerase-like protein (cupin superfamily)